MCLMVLQIYFTRANAYPLKLSLNALFINIEFNICYKIIIDYI